MSASGIEAEVCRDIATRQQEGINKYGTTVAANPAELLEWLQHDYEETLDKAIYIKRAMAEIPIWEAAYQEEIKELQREVERLEEELADAARELGEQAEPDFNR